MLKQFHNILLTFLKYGPNIINVLQRLIFGLLLKDD